MLGKLIKHEFKATYWEFTILFIAILGVSGMEKIFFEINSDNPIVAMFAILCTAMYVICLVGGSIGSVVLIVKRFYVNLVKEQGYLSFTLPVSVSQHIISKMIVAVVWTIATYIVMIIAVGIILIGDGAGEILGDVSKLIGLINAYGVWGYVVEFGALMLIGLFVTALQYYACIAVGQMIGKHKVLGTVAAYFANGMITNIIATLFIFLLDRVMATRFEKDIELMSDMEVLQTYGATALHMYLGLMVIMAIVYFFVTKILLEKKLNLE